MAADLTAETRSEQPAHATRRRRWRRAVVVAAIVGAVGVAAVAGVVAGGAADPGGRVKVEGAAPGFDLPRVGADGERVRLADFAGEPLVVNFWASWCVPCRKEMPALQAVAERLQGRVAFVGINHLDASEDAADFQRAVGASYPSGHDPDGAVAREWAVMGLPTTIVVDSDGRIVARRLGEVSEDELLGLLAESLDVDVGGRS